MHEVQILVGFAGYVALLLWGVRMVQTGVQRAFGQALSVWMRQAMGAPPRAFMVGLLVTAAIQSSTATGLLVGSFAMDGLVSLVPGLAAMLGANVGTTLIVQALSFDLSDLAPGLILIGVWMFRRHAPGRTRDLGRVFIGLGLLLLSLEELVSIFEPLKNAPALGHVLSFLGSAPFLALAAATIITWASHSSVAVVVLIMSLAHNGLVSPETAYILVLGANLGTAVNPVLEGGNDGNPASRRVPVGNVGTRIAGCAVALALAPWAGQVMHFMSADSARAVANFHLAFNLIVALCFMPVLKGYAHLLQKLLPEQTNAEDPARPRYLDESARDVPTIVLAQARREALRLTDLLEESLELTRKSLTRGDSLSISRGRQLNRTISELDRAITAFLATQDQENIGTEDSQTLEDILTFSSNIARAASVSDARLLSQASALRKKRWMLTSEQKSRLGELLQRVQDNLKRATALFVSGDRAGARHLAFEKDHFRDLEAKATQQHLDQIRSGRLETLDSDAFCLELLRDAAELNAYLVEAAAYPVLERFGELRPNRLQETEESS
ncbi:Phosphate:Na+ symporter OS=Castellaniella defragrans OX=75697 GN=HNR28_003177 PE=4 SV=1 [Castellaniella defragrans]